MAPIQGLPPAKTIATHTEAQKGAMMRGRAKAKPNKALAAAAGGAVSPLQQQAQSEIDPIIAAIRAAALGQAKASDAEIQGLTNSYAQGIAGINYGSPYSGAEAQQAAVDAALQQSATGQGSDLASGLSQRLQALQGSSGANAVNQEAAALTNQGAGIGSANVASGSAALNQLIADAAAAQSYGQKMPGVIRSAGLQGIEQAQGQAQQTINQATQQAESELPSIEQTLRADKLQAQQNKAEAAYRNATLGLRAQTLASENAYRKAEIGLRGQSLQVSQQRLNLEAQKAADSSKLDWARVGIENRRLQMEIAKQDLSARSGGLSNAEVSRYTALADSWASRMGSKTVDPTTGKIEPGLSFKDAMTEALKSGVPLSIALPIFTKEARAQGATPGQLKQLERYYAPLDGALAKTAKTLAGTGKVLGSLVFAGEKGLRTPQQRMIVQLAHEYMGTPYQWGGESPKGFDCSGFAQYLYGKAGISIPRTTYTQWAAGHAVNQNQLQPGDLVFFKGSDSINGLPGHVGIYIGGGKMIDAPHTGADVRIDNVASFGGYMGARRYGKA